MCRKESRSKCRGGRHFRPQRLLQICPSSVSRVVPLLIAPFLSPAFLLFLSSAVNILNAFIGTTYVNRLMGLIDDRCILQADTACREVWASMTRHAWILIPWSGFVPPSTCLSACKQWKTSHMEANPVARACDSQNSRLESYHAIKHVEPSQSARSPYIWT